MAEHKADTYNMFKSLVKHFPEYSEILANDENQQINPNQTMQN